MSYQLNVRFNEPRRPSISELKEALSSFHLVTDSSHRTIKIGDAMSDVSLELMGKDTVESLEMSIPYFGSIESLVTGYSVAQTLANTFSATVEDPQLANHPSIFLAKQAWRKGRGPYILERAFDGKLPRDLKLKITQGWILDKVTYEVTGTDILVRWKSQLKSGQYLIPLLSLEEPQERVVRSGRWYSLLAPGFMFLFFATTQTGLTQGILAILGFGLFFVSPILYFLVKFPTIIFPGSGGSLFLSSGKRSKTEVLQFLDSVERVKAALIRYGAGRLREPGEPSGVV